MSRRVLIVDDDDDYARLLALSLRPVGYVSTRASGAEEALALLERGVFDLVLTDLHMPPGPGGIELLQRARAQGEAAPFIVLTGQATIETAVQAIREGAFDYLRKTASADELRLTAERAIEHARMQREVSRLRSEVARAVGADAVRPVGESPAYLRVLAVAERVAASDASVLLLGESGTGKELLARAIHRWSPRGDQSFIAFDCSALAPSLVESELFGHEKGAFTGAQRARRGLFREAAGGTLFLDEIGDIPAEVQNKLLRVLQEREVRPVGGDSTVKIDVRLLAATNKDLRRLVAEGRFREDLYYRLAVVPIELPPLRERTGDLPLLVAHFLGTERRGPRARRVSPEALARLEAYAWPGNIRELENVLERAMLLCEGDEIGPGDLPIAVGSAPGSPVADSRAGALPDATATVMPSALASIAEGRPLSEILDAAAARIEQEALREALRLDEGSATRAARRLGISRAAFYNKLKRHRITT